MSGILPWRPGSGSVSLHVIDAEVRWPEAWVRHIHGPLPCSVAQCPGAADIYWAAPVAEIQILYFVRCMYVTFINQNTHLGLRYRSADWSLVLGLLILGADPDWYLLLILWWIQNTLNQLIEVMSIITLIFCEPRRITADWAQDPDWSGLVTTQSRITRA